MAINIPLWLLRDLKIGGLVATGVVIGGLIAAGFIRWAIMRGVGDWFGW